MPDTPEMRNGVTSEYIGRDSQLAESRALPSSVAAEACVIGSALFAPMETIGQCVERFRGRRDVFLDDRAKTVWSVLLEMYDKQEAIDLVLVCQRLRDKGVLEQCGGYDFLNGCMDQTPSAVNLPAYLDTVVDKWLLRQVIERCAAAIDRAYAFSGKDPDKFVLEVESDISALTESYAESSEEHVKEILKRVLGNLEEHYKRGSTQLAGLPTGAPGNYLDKIILGIRDTHYVVAAGRPGDGKTSWAMNVVEYLALEHVEHVMRDGVMSEVKGMPVGVISIEMDADCLVQRLLLGRAGVDSATFHQGYAQGEAFVKIKRAVDELAKANIYVDATPAQTIGQIAAKARRMVKQYGIKLFVLDYLQLVEQEGSSGFDRQKELTKISRKIMALKKQLRVPWLVLAQMNRNIETAESKRPPLLSDLKDCGAIEQDADVVLFLHKPDRKEVNAQPANGGESDQQIIDRVADAEKMSWSEKPYRVNAFVAKNRFGPTGIAKMVFCKNLCRFEDWHLWKVKHGMEQLKMGERETALGLSGAGPEAGAPPGTEGGPDLPSNEEMNL